MNQHIKNYFNSFKVKKKFWCTFLIDAVFLAIVSLVFFAFSNLLKLKSASVIQGKTTEQLQQMLLTMNSAEAEALLSSLKEFLVILIIGMIITFVGGLLLFSFSRKMLWNYLTDKNLMNKKTGYWRWNALHLALILLSPVYLLVLVVVKFILSYLVSFSRSAMAVEVTSSLISFFFVLVLLFLVFFIYYSFVHKYKVWESLGNAFHMLKANWKQVWSAFLLTLITGIILTLLLWPVGKFFPSHLKSYLLIINFIVSLLYIAWIRMYLLGIVSHEHS